jgi:sec-independent protein translocase protein TatA
MGSIGAPEIIIVAVVAILLFGASKLPIFAKSLGESLRIFKKELKTGDERRGPELPPVLAERGTLPATPVEGTDRTVHTERTERTETR